LFVCSTTSHRTQRTCSLVLLKHQSSEEAAMAGVGTYSCTKGSPRSMRTRLVFPAMRSPRTTTRIVYSGRAVARRTGDAPGTAVAADEDSLPMSVFYASALVGHLHRLQRVENEAKRGPQIGVGGPAGLHQLC